jgi:LmbE family N-acetylglucosaminyl deacetylase
MVVAAHPDDCEVGCGATIAKWADEGSEVYLLIATNGDKGDDEAKTTPEELAAIREVEAQHAADVLGVKEMVILPRRDGELIYSIDLRGDVVRYIRKWKPDVVITHDPRVHIGAMGGINHADHRAIGEATVDAVYPFARGRHQYPEQIAEGLEPHTVYDMLLWGANPPNYWVDVTGYVDRKIDALREHKSQFSESDRVGRFVRQRMKQAGEEHGAEAVEPFAHVSLRRWGPPPPETEPEET